MTGMENARGLDVEDGYKVNMLMAGFVTKAFKLDGSAISNEYVWVEVSNITTEVQIKTLHVFGKYRYNIIIDDEYGKFASMVIHMPKPVPTDPFLYDWHMTLFTKSDDMNVIYAQDNGITYIKNHVDLFNDGVIDEPDAFYSFVEFGGKGRYFCCGCPISLIK